ncbi:MAG: ABC transporter ATP-binding protein [Burkholderiaceae bacterium]|nr:ABC transporter ATP-binding protein [Burkholderiaceae bacterium]
MIEVSELDVGYGGVPAVKGASLSVRKGEIVALLGANGAGKSTLLRAIAGLVPKAHGVVRLADTDITESHAADIARLGLALVPESRHLFGPMTVIENLELGAFSWLGFRGSAQMRGDLDAIMALFPKLADRRSQVAATLSGGEQQMLAIGRALMARPAVILMDEPSIGLAPMIVREIFRVIVQLREMGRTILLVEQNARMALGIADRAYVLERGVVTLQGPAAELRSMERVRELYLGG